MSKIQLLKRSKKMFFCFPAICLLLSGCGLFNNSVQPINIVTEESTVSIIRLILITKNMTK